LVNTSDKKKQLEIDIKNQKLAGTATALILSSDQLTDENSFENLKKIIPQESELSTINNQLSLEIDPFTFMVIKIGLE